MVFYLRFIVLQTILAAGLYAAYLAGIAQMPFHGLSAPFCIAVSVALVIGLLFVLVGKFKHARFIASNILLLGLLGTVVGLIVAFSALSHGISSDPEAIRAAIGGVITGMFVALFTTAFGISSRIWLGMNIFLLSGEM